MIFDFNLKESPILNSQVNIDIIPKKALNYRVKIVEIKVTDQGIFALTVPYKDHKLTKEDKNFKIEGIIYNLNIKLNKTK